MAALSSATLTACGDYMRRFAESWLALEAATSLEHLP